MINSSSLFTNQFESSIQQLLQIESQKKLQLQDQRNVLRDQQTALSDIDSKLSALNTQLTSFIDSTADTLQPMTGSSSNPDAVSIVSASGLDNPDTFSIDVSQVAKNDIVLSDAVNETGTDYNSTGSGSFDIAIGSGTAITINVDTNGLNNHEVLEAIATQVDDQLGDQVNASVYKLGDGTSKLSFKSIETGDTNRISITNQQGDLSGLNLTHTYTEDQLNAKFTFDGVTFERSSNLIDDVVGGLTFELHKTTTATESLNIERDTEEARNNIEEFVEKFNSVNDIIRSKTFLDGDTGAKGILQEERTVRNLSYNLRNAATLTVDSLSGSSIDNLRNIGIELDSNGTMQITDSTKLDEALSQNSDKVADLFSATDGVAATLQNEIDKYITGNTNIFSSIEDGIDRQIDRLDDRIQREEKYLIRKEEELRKEFAELDKVINQGQTQFDQVLNFRNKIGF
jgi:flagellar hook-associated protein 2